MNDCPFCDFKAGFSQELVFHLHARHTGQHQPIGTWADFSVNCWCGQGPFVVALYQSDAVSPFGVHLQRHGGATAHWLEHSLGLANPFGDSIPYTRRPMP